MLAAREVGERPWRIIFYELMPNQIGLIAASFVGVFLYAILTSVALAFLGITNFSDWNYGDISSGLRAAVLSSSAHGGGTCSPAWRSRSSA